MNEVRHKFITLYARTDKRTLLLILSVLLVALFVLAAGAPCVNPPK